MFSKTKNYFLKKYISDNKPQRNVQLVDLNHAKSIAMLCEITNEDSYKNIFQIFTKLQNSGRQVKLIGYVNDTAVPFYCLPQLSADYFCNKNLNWFGMPNLIQLQDFLKVEYDMLIDFNTNLYQPIQALLALSKSRFIVGRQDGSRNHYDLFINDDKTDNNKFLESIHNYTLKLTGNDR